MTTHGKVTPDGRPSPWLSVYMQATKQLNGLALRLRLGPQSRASKAPKTLPRELSYYDEMAETEGEDDGVNSGRS
jgi:hypothetical protein